MIHSTFILDIFDLLFDGDEIGVNLRKQVNFLTEAEYEYTSVGVFVNFTYSIGIDKYRILSTALNHGDVLNGVTIHSDKNNVEADAQVFLKDGLICYLEIWNKIGDYPSKDLDDYVMTQDWKDAPGRQRVKTST